MAYKGQNGLTDAQKLFKELHNLLTEYKDLLFDQKAIIGSNLNLHVTFNEEVMRIHIDLDKKKMDEGGATNYTRINGDLN